MDKKEATTEERQRIDCVKSGSVNDDLQIKKVDSLEQARIAKIAETVDM